MIPYAADAVWDHSTFSKNRDRLLEGEIAAKFLTALLAQPEVKRLLSTELFSVDGTLIEAWASIKSFRLKDGGDQDNDGPGRNAERSFHKEKRSNDTHQSTTDPEARLCQRAAESPQLWACNFLHLAGLGISRLRDRQLHSWAVGRAALKASGRPSGG